MSRAVYIEIRTTKEKFPVDRLRRYFKKYVEEKDDPFLKELLPALLDDLRVARRTGFFKSYITVGRNQTVRMGLLELLGRPEEAIQLETKMMAAILGVFVEAMKEAAEKVGGEMELEFRGAKVKEKEDLEAIVKEADEFVSFMQQLRRELKTREYAKRLNEVLKTAAAFYFGDVYAVRLYNLLKDVTGRYADLEAVYEDEGFIPALGVTVRFREGREEPDIKSASAFILNYLVEAAKTPEKKDVILDELDAVMIFWEAKYGKEFVEKANAAAREDFRQNRKFLLECPEDLLIYVSKIKADKDYGVIIGPGNTVIYSLTGSNVFPLVIRATSSEKRYAEAPRRVSVSELPNYGKFYNPPGLDDAYKRMLEYATCPRSKPYLSILEWAVKVREEQKAIVGEREERGLSSLRKLLSL